MPQENQFNHVGETARGPLSGEMDFASARETMVESQLRPSGVNDRRVIAAMQTVPRERFVSSASQTLAYMDGAAPVDGAPGEASRYLLPPMVLARMVQTAEPTETERVLVVGCTSGYSVAILAELAGEVIGVESDQELAAQAERNLKALNISNARIHLGPLADGAASEGPYDLILLDGSVPTVPDGLEEQLKEGGRLIGVVSNGEQGTVYLFWKIDGELAALGQFSAGAKPLPGIVREVVFHF